MNKWNIDASEAPNPTAITMYPSCDNVEYARILLMSFCCVAISAASNAVTPPIHEITSPACDTPTRNDTRTIM